jgi:hypothetical protein
MLYSLSLSLLSFLCYQIITVQFMSFRLRSLALGLNHPVRCSDYWGPIAEEVLKREGHPYVSWDYDKLVEYLPKLNVQKTSPTRLRQVIEKIIALREIFSEK